MDTAGFLVADNRGRVVGKVRAGFFSRHRRLVPADTIADVDPSSRVVGLRVARESIRRFL
jgi:hypothetical protein